MRASKLPDEIKKLVIKQVETWPKSIEPVKLIERLDSFAEEVIETQKVLDIAKELRIK